MEIFVFKLILLLLEGFVKEYTFDSIHSWDTKKRKKDSRTILELLSKNNIYVTTLVLVCNQNKVLERCGLRMQLKSHIHTPKSVKGIRQNTLDN
jgi:hypothetical protein